MKSLWHWLAAWSGLALRYSRVFSSSWKSRRATEWGLLTEDEASFLPAALALQEMPVSATARWTARLLILLVILVLAWAVLGQVDIVVTATGKIVPTGSSKTITSVDVAAVRALHVKEGQWVRAGDVLVELDTAESDAEQDKARGDAEAALLQQARARALILALDTSTSPMLPAISRVPAPQRDQARRQLESQYGELTAKLARIDTDVAQYSQDLKLAEQRVADYQVLLEHHDVSEHAWIEKEQARVELAGRLSSAQSERSALVAQTRREAQDALTEGSKLEAASLQDERKAGAHSRHLVLVTPVDGTVQQLNIHTVGAAVPAAQPLMVIVPKESRLEVEAYIENKDVGFVRDGQSAEAKITAFEYTKYGTVPARVLQVSRDAIEDEKRGPIFSTRILLDRTSMDVDGQTVELSPGMAATVEIKTGTRRVIEYVLSPLIQHAHEALHER